jgi:hypothetical protein
MGQEVSPKMAALDYGVVMADQGLELADIGDKDDLRFRPPMDVGMAVRIMALVETEVRKVKGKGGVVTVNKFGTHVFNSYRVGFEEDYGPLPAGTRRIENGEVKVKVDQAALKKYAEHVVAVREKRAAAAAKAEVAPREAKSKK